MRRSDAEAVLETLLDDLAAIEHNRWAHWQRYMHEKGERQPDGSLILPAELVQHWETQIVKRYDELSESEKESDREQVLRYIPIIASAFSERGNCK